MVLGGMVCRGTLAYASEDLRRDRGLVLAAVSQNGGALEYAARDLRKDYSAIPGTLEKKVGVAD
eukprot:5881290-Amphidinium_carterae.1